MTEPSWAPPDITGARFEFRVATSVVEEIARNHTPADVLRELVQNEYDAGGGSIDIVFKQEALVVTGSGTPIDESGWRRLKV